MKKMIMILGYVFLAFVVILAAGTATVIIIGNTADKESKAYVDAAVPAIVSAWDAGELLKRASPEFNETVDKDDLQESFYMLSGLGELKEYHGSTGEAKISISFQNGFVITAAYEAGADFETGSVEIQVTLIKQSGRWRILGFKISPAETMEKKDII